MYSLFKNLQPLQLLVLSFGLLILIGTILLEFPVSLERGQSISFIDALFTATSAVCVTGLVAVDTPQTFSTFGEVVIMLLIQFGGLGIITFTTVLLVLMGGQVSYKNKLILKESFALSRPGQVRQLAWIVIKLTLIIELIGTILLAIAFSRDMSLLKATYFGVFHSVSAFCNAGFSLFSNNLEGYVTNWIVNLTIMGLIVLGGLGFPVLAEIISRRNKTPLSVRARIVILTSVFLIFAGALFLHIYGVILHKHEYLALSSEEKLLSCLFQSVSARTAGFNSVNLNIFPQMSQVVLVALMFIGGSPQGTAGGIKTTTFWIIVMGAWNYLRGMQGIRAWRKEITSDSFTRAVVLFMAAFLLLAVATSLLVFFKPLDPFALLFEATSAFGTVGLSLGITSSLAPIQKLIIIMLMFIGRVGPISFAFFFVTKKKQSKLNYPEIEIPIG